MAIRDVYLIRHGQYHLDRESAQYGTLTGLGRRQSKGAGRLLRSLPVTRLHCSDLPRALETATIIRQSLPKLELSVSGRLRECFPGVPLSMVRNDHAELSDVELLHRLRKNKRFRQRVERGVAREFGLDTKWLARGESRVEDGAVDIVEYH